MVISQQGERYFTSDDVAITEPGLIISRGRVRVCYREHDPVSAVRIALVLARYCPVDAVAMAPAEAVAGAGLALAFAKHLRRMRCQRGLRGACVTSPARPLLPGTGLVRVPHLLALEDPSGGWCDQAMWEVMPDSRFAASFGRPPTALAGVEEQVPQLLALRGAVRDGSLPDTPEAGRLRELLRTRYLSIRLVLEQRRLVDALLAQHLEETS